MFGLKNIKVCDDDVSSLESKHSLGFWIAPTSSSYSYSDPQRYCNVGGFDFYAIGVLLFSYLRIANIF